MKTVIEMAEEAGFERLFEDTGDWVCFTDEIERFAELVIANNPPRSSMAWQEGYECGVGAFMEAVKIEREACAKVCEATDDGTPYNLAEECAAAIRARGTHET